MPFNNSFNRHGGGGRQWNGGGRPWNGRGYRGNDRFHQGGRRQDHHKTSAEKPSGHTACTEELKALLDGEGFPDPAKGCWSVSLRLDKVVTIGGSEAKLRELKAVVKSHNDHQNAKETFVPRVDFKPLVGTLRSNLIINQAGGVLENAGISLHPHFNVPFIAGSAVKGVARHAAWCEWKAVTDESRKKDLSERIAATFGYPTQADDLDKALEKSGCSKQSGSVAFMAAYPCNKNGDAAPATLAMDILTPHGGNDWTNPVPNSFPVVQKGTSFKFVVGPAKFGGEKCIEDAIQWLKTGLTAGGLGAKTAAGYGVFKIQGEPVPIAAKSYTLRLVSPAFLRGALGDEGKLRESSLRGVIRYWWRILFRSVLGQDDLSKLETIVWGGAEKPPTASQIVIRLVPTSDGQIILFDKEKQAHMLPRSFDQKRTTGVAYASYGMDDFKKVKGNKVRTQRRVLLPGAEWRLEVSFRPRDGISINTLALHFELALKALCTYGGIGAKSRKGFGSLDCGMELDISDTRLRNEMADAVTPFGLALDPDRAGDYSFLSKNRLDPLSVTLDTRNVWAAVDRIGYAMQATAASYKHRRIKAAAGLPRKIHGPDKKGPLKNQHGRWAPPESLRPEGGTLPKADRFASPLFVHVAPGENGNLKVNAIAFPSRLVRSIDDSREVLDAYLEDIQSILQETRWN